MKRKVEFTFYTWFYLFSFFYVCITPHNRLYATELSTKTQPLSRQTLNIGIGDNPNTLDPQLMEDQVSFRIAYDLYEGLTTEADDGTIIPGVAERYSVDSTGKIYTFYLRHNAKFSDGSFIRASDVVFSFRRLADPKIAAPLAHMSRYIENASLIIDGQKRIQDLGIKAINPTTVQIKLKHPVPYFLNMIAAINFSIVKEENVNKYKNSFTKPGNLVSSGAYMLTDARLGDKFSAQKNPYYWNASHTKIQSVNYLPVHDTHSEFQMYQAGQIDFTFSLPPNSIQKIKADFPKEIRINPLLGIYYLTLNTRQKPFKNNLKLRQSLSMAIDRDVLTKTIVGRAEIPAYDLIPFGTFNYVQQKYDWQFLPDSKRFAEANHLFFEAGYSNEHPLQITLTSNTDNLHKKVMLAVISMWQKVFGKKSILVTIKNLERKVFYYTVQSGEFVMSRDSWFADYNDPSEFTGLLISNNSQNFSGYENMLYDKIIAQADLEQNLEKRKEFLEKGMKLALADYPVIPLFEYVSIHLVKPYVVGYSGKNILDHIYTRNLGFSWQVPLKQ